MRSLTQRRPFVTAAVLAASFALAGFSAQAATAETLVGEQFVSGEHTEAFVYSGECNPDGPSTFSFSSGGRATGPIPGDFSESGSFTLASPTGPVSAFSANYTIRTADGGRVSGTKSLASGATGSCSTEGVDASFDVRIPAQYQVSAPFSETGPALVTLHGAFATGSLVATFGAIPAGPTSKEQCMNGGYATFGFRNQGQCIKAVNHR